MNKKYLFYFLISAGIFIGCEKDSDKENIETEPIVFTKEGELQIYKSSGDLVKELDIEVADDDYERATGLMHRESMQDDQGMLFIFDEAAPRFFYMKNTLIPLDIIYFGSDSTIVSFQKNAKPKDLTTLPSEDPAQFVLEVNAGLADEWKLEEGDKIDFEISH